VNWVTHFDKTKYDLVLLHIDQQCVLERLGKSKLFKDMKNIVKDSGVPIIIINHGTPCYPEVIEWNDCKKKMRSKVKFADKVIVNSYQAADDWGFGETIWHGMDANEWWDLPKEPRVTTFISAAGLGNKYYGRFLFFETRRILREEYGITHLWIGEEVAPQGFNTWDEYKNFLGGSLIYFNPTYGSPMPRSRTEAMLSGCAVVTTRHHDVEKFIKHGENGYICKDNPKDAARLIADLYFNYKKAIEMGQKGKETAKRVFSMRRFQQDWISLIEKTIGRKI